MNRQEHIKWCKERAIEEARFYPDKPWQGIVSMMSDLRKHSETNSRSIQLMCTMQMITKPKMSLQEVINFINGFN